MAFHRRPFRGILPAPPASARRSFDFFLRQRARLDHLREALAIAPDAVEITLALVLRFVLTHGGASLRGGDHGGRLF